MTIFASQLSFSLKQKYLLWMFSSIRRARFWIQDISAALQCFINMLCCHTFYLRQITEVSRALDVTIKRIAILINRAALCDGKDILVGSGQKISNLKFKWTSTRALRAGFFKYYEPKHLVIEIIMINQSRSIRSHRVEGLSLKQNQKCGFLLHTVIQTNYRSNSRWNSSLVVDKYEMNGHVVWLLYCGMSALMSSNVSPVVPSRGLLLTPPRRESCPIR